MTTGTAVAIGAAAVAVVAGAAALVYRAKLARTRRERDALAVGKVIGTYGAGQLDRSAALGPDGFGAAMGMGRLSEQQIAELARRRPGGAKIGTW